ncbi:MAG: TonB-dependent receptor [Flavobacteriaceae bacterium]
MKPITLFIGLMLFAFTSLNAQNKILVSGTVVDNQGMELPGATIILKETSRGFTTDFEGRFTMKVNKGQAYTLICSYVGYKTYEKQINFSEESLLEIVLEKDNYILDEVIVSAVRVQANAPVTHSSLNKKEISERNLGQDIPVLMNYMPAVVTTSDAGAGIGYTGIRVRGTDATRVNVTINGIAYNDSESMGTFWVNLPDFASSTESLQLQRGVGTSTNGAGAFGASLNLLTDAFSEEAYGSLSFSAGSFNTFKETAKFSTGRLNENFELAGRISKIDSDGYIDRASSDLRSYFLQASYSEKNTLLKLITFGGAEKTYQAWYGIDQETLDTDRRFNPAGMYTDANGETQFYDNQTDNYKQDHYQLLWTQTYNNNWTSNFALHYTYGRGYYESYKDDAYYPDYGLSPIEVDGNLVEEADLINQKWLDNHYYGFTSSVNYKSERVDFTLGGAYSMYKGDHFGHVIWAQYSGETRPSDRYYDNYGDKNDGNIFTKVSYAFSEKLLGFLDLQGRFVHYKTDGVADGAVDVNYQFFNPKVGLTYNINTYNNLYASFAVANREPNRTDFENGSPEPETLNDLEFGWRWKKEGFRVNTNMYYMAYQNQLVLTGALDDVGNPIRTNVGESYRLGLEFDVFLRLGNQFYLQPNLALSSNKNLDFVFERDGELDELGKTNIAFSPEIVVGNKIAYMPIPNMEISLFSKYVGEQYMANIDSENSKLAAYLTHDLVASYEMRTKKVFKSIGFSAMFNNIFNTAYVSNGYYYTYDDTWSNPGQVVTLDGAGYYPQAQFNFLLGVNFNF